MIDFSSWGEGSCHSGGAVPPGPLVATPLSVTTKTIIKPATSEMLRVCLMIYLIATKRVYNTGRKLQWRLQRLTGTNMASVFVIRAVQDLSQSNFFCDIWCLHILADQNSPLVNRFSQFDPTTLRPNLHTYICVSCLTHPLTLTWTR